MDLEHACTDQPVPVICSPRHGSVQAVNRSRRFIKARRVRSVIETETTDFVLTYLKLSGIGRDVKPCHNRLTSLVKKGRVL